MKAIKILIAMFAAACVTTACDPIEDESLYDEYIKGAGTPITKAELQSALTVTQPFPNVDGKVEGDQYVILKNARPDIGGTWHLGWGAGEKTLATDNDTVIYESNGEFGIYYVGISENTIVQTDPIMIKVTNVFDPWSGHFTGAKDKADSSAKKTWKFREVSWGSVCNMGAHGGWKYTDAGYVPESSGFAWWGSMTASDVGEVSMTFEFDGNKMKTFNADGSLKAEGNFSFTHNQPEKLVLGELITTIPTIGSQFDDCGQGNGSNKFWILTLNDDYITIYHPANYNAGDAGDWGDYGWYAYFKAVQ